MRGFLIILLFVSKIAFSQVDYNEKGKFPCRVGGGKSFTIGNTIISGVVSTTWIELSYINKPPYNAFGEQVLGNDTIKIYRNPNNSGIWNTITTGYVGGTYDIVSDTGCPVYIQPYDTNIVEWRDYWRVGAAATGDTNWVNGLKINGLANRQGANYVYGFHSVNGSQNGLFIGNNFRNLEVCGVFTDGVGWIFKRDVDTTKSWTEYPNYNTGPVYFHDNYVLNPLHEANYDGSTDVDGNQFHGGHPACHYSDGNRFERTITINSGWDGGFQWSVLGSNNLAKNIVVWKAGQLNQSSQQTFSLMPGGYSQGVVDSSVFVNSTGGFTMLGQGSDTLRNSIIDSCYNGNGAATGQVAIYCQQAVVSTPPPKPDSLRAYVLNNIISRVEKAAIQANNVSGSMKAGAFSNNTIVDATRTTSLILNNVTGQVITPNTYKTSLNIDTTTLAQSLKSWQVYQLLRTTYPPGSTHLVSFFDVETNSGGQNYLKVIKRGTRLRRWNF